MFLPDGVKVAPETEPLSRNLPFWLSRTGVHTCSTAAERQASSACPVPSGSWVSFFLSFFLFLNGFFFPREESMTSAKYVMQAHLIKFYLFTYDFKKNMKHACEAFVSGKS